jgi:hypothetical protein
MNINRLLFLILVFCPCCIIAQEKSDSLLYKIFRAKNNSDLFAGVDVIKKAKKDNINAEIKALSISSRTEIIKSADLAQSAPWTMLTWSQFNEFKITGNRVNYEKNYFSRRNKLSRLIIGELVAKDGRYLKEIVNGLGLICEESTWALPAHMSLQKAGNGLPDVNEPIIDLFVAQTGMILSYAKYLLGDELALYSPLLIQRIDFELKKRVFDPYLTRDDFWWMGFNTTRKMNNWNIFINTNVLSCAILAEDDPKLRKLMIEKSIKSVDNFLRSYPADGGCDEGPSYWGIAGGALIEYIDLLSVFSGEKLDFSKNKLIHQIGAYIYKVHIDQNHYVNFADAGVVNKQDVVKIYKFGRLFNDEKLLQFAAYLRQINRGAGSIDLGSINGFVNSLEIRNEFTNLKAVAPQLSYVWLNDVQILTARQEQGNAKGLFFAAKGGNNAESHNHNDVGNFVVYKDGTPMIVDAGVGVYTRQTFSADRYKLWYMQSDWHNCPTINGVAQQAGRSYRAASISSETGGNITKLSMDIAAAYPEEAGVSSWMRTFVFNHQAGVVRLKEDYHLKRLKEGFSLNFLINGTVAWVKKGVLKLTNAQGKTVLLIYDPGKFDYQVEIKKIDDARLAASWHNDLSRLILKTKGKQLKGTHQIEFRNE